MTAEEEIAEIEIKILDRVDAADKALERATAAGDQPATQKAKTDLDKANKAYEEFREIVDKEFAEQVNQIVGDLRAIMEKYNYT